MTYATTPEQQGWSERHTHDGVLAAWTYEPDGVKCLVCGVVEALSRPPVDTPPLLPVDDPNSGWMPDMGRPITGHGIPDDGALFWLLGKYANHVQQEEGVTFVEPERVNWPGDITPREAAWVRRALREYLEFPHAYDGRL